MTHTLKIKWHRADGNNIVDETTLFIPVDELHVHSEVKDISEMKSWDKNGAEYLDYRWTIRGDVGDYTHHPGRLINAIKDGKSTWYIASAAWLLGAGGATIERVAP